MKRKVLILVVFVLSLLLAGFAPQCKTIWSDPTASALSGDTSFTAAIITPANLAGSYENSLGTPLPTGFPKGEVQFGGNALKLSGIDGGTQKICFAFPTYPYGWRGGVYQWNGTKWAKLTTSITPGAEGTPALACATSYGNGEYALLVWFNQKLAPIPEPVVSPTPSPTPIDDGCIEDIELGAWERDAQGIHLFEFLLTGSFNPPLGTPFTWEISDVSPAGFITPLSGADTTFMDEGLSGMGINGLDTPDGDTSTFTFTFKAFFPECHMITLTVVQPPLPN